MLARGVAAYAWVLAALTLADSSPLTAAQAPAATSPPETGARAAEDDAAASAAPVFPALPGILDDYRSLHVGSAYDATGRAFRIGHLRVNFRSGTLSSILTKSGREAGFVFEGEGHYTYVTEDAGDLQSIEKNILANVNTNAYRDGTLTEEAKGCIFVSTCPLLAEILSGGSESKGPAPEKAGSKLGSFLSGVDDADIGLDHAAAISALGGQPVGIVYGEIDSQVVDPGYYYDPRVTRQERLLLYRTILGDRFARVVSRQPIPEGRVDSPVVMTRLDFSLSTNNNKDGDVTAVETFRFDGSSGRLLPMTLINHDEDSANNWKPKSRILEVRSVKTSDGKELPFSHRYHSLVVELPELPTAGSEVSLTFDLGLHFLARKDGDQYFRLDGGIGFPEPQWLNSVKATSHWKVKTRKPYLAFVGGKVLSRSEENGSAILEAETDRPSLFQILIAGKFFTKEQVKDGVRVGVNLYAANKARAQDAYLEAAFALLDEYGKMLVPYPRKELDILEVRLQGFWQSPAGLILLDSEPLSVQNTRRDPRSMDTVNRVFAHEFAHQWWGNLVAPKDWSTENWISESIAEYLGALAFAAAEKDPKVQKQRMDGALARWWKDAEMSRKSVSISQAGYLRGGSAERSEWKKLLYGKGPLVVRMLHTTLGDERFFGLLRTILTKYGNKEIDTDEFAKEASAVAGQDMTWFFRQWIREPGIPDLDVSKSVSRESGKTYLTGHLKQRDPAHFKILLLPFVFESGGSRSVKLVQMDKSEQDFRVELAADASNVVLDPGKNNLVYYH